MERCSLYELGSVTAAFRLPVGPHKMAGLTKATIHPSCLDQFNRKPKARPLPDTWIDSFIRRLTRILKSIQTTG